MKRRFAWMPLAILAFAPPCWAVSWLGSFESGALDPGRWTSDADGGASFDVSGGRLNVDIPEALAASDTYVSVRAVLPAVGDCDYQVDYRLENWPIGCGVRVGLFAHFLYGPIVVHRYNYAAGYPEEYLMSFGSWWTAFPTSDTEGTLRFQRQGRFVAGYAWVQGGWQEVGSWGLAGTEDLGVSLGVWTHSSVFGGQATRVSFDNFQFTDSAVPEPMSLVSLGLGVLIASSRRRTAVR